MCNNNFNILSIIYKKEINMNKYVSLFNNYFESKFILNFPEVIRDKINNLILGGKRLRPLIYLCYSGIMNEKIDKNNHVNNDVNNDVMDNIIMDLGCIIELVHNISLIIDDLPEMDNELTRRDQPTFHIKNGIEYTHFFIYYLLNKCMLILTNSLNIYLEDEKYNKENYKFLLNIIMIFKKNLNNLIDGQYLDLDSENNKCVNNKSVNIGVNNVIIIEQLIYDILVSSSSIDMYLDPLCKLNILKNIKLNLKKTGSLFNLSILSGIIIQLWSLKRDNIEVNLEYIDLNNIYDMYYQIFNKTNKMENSINKNDNNILETNNNNIFKLIIIFSYLLGYIFQISDDLLDIENDLINNKPNICIDTSLEICIEFLEKGCNILHQLNISIYEKSKQKWPIVNIDYTIMNEIINKIKKRKS